MSTSPAHEYLAAKLSATTAIVEYVVGAMTGAPEAAGQGAVARAAEHERRALALRDAEPARIPMLALAARLGLSAHQDHVLWLLLAHELVPEARALVRAVGGTQAPDPTVDAVRRIVYGNAPSTAWRDLAPEGLLSRWLLIDRTDGGGPDVPEYRRTLRVARRVVALAHGAVDVDPEIAAVARIAPRLDGATFEYAGQPGDVIARHLDGARRELVVVAGKQGSGRRSLIVAAAAARGHAVLEVDGRRLAIATDALSRQLRAIAREAKLLSAVVVVTQFDALAGEAADGTNRLELVDRDLLAEVDAPVFATATRAVPGRWSRPPVTVELAPLSGRQLAVLWARAIPRLHSADADHLARAYPLAPALIRRAGDAVAARATGDRVTQADLREAIRTVLDDRIGGLATRVVTSQRWDDLVLAPDQLEPVVELIARVRERRRVYEDWGFARKVGKGLGVTALFSGPPGTGKTMVAGLIAAELELELYQVDLSKIVSKWIGETEKHLAELFDAAEAGHAVLLFDEADALFTKRTEVKSSNDRNANLEVNYLLQRLEAFTGICILTTNHDAAIDDAFRRRLALHVRFTTPDELTRATLWQSMLPAGAPVGDDLDFAALAQRYPMTGGHIRNATLRAAFLAADESTAITHDHLARGGRMELEALGRIAS